MTKYEDMIALRNHPDIHYNCAQSVLIPFAEDMGITREQANALSAHSATSPSHRHLRSGVPFSRPLTRSAQFTLPCAARNCSSSSN